MNEDKIVLLKNNASLFGLIMDESSIGFDEVGKFNANTKDCKIILVELANKKIIKCELNKFIPLDKEAQNIDSQDILILQDYINIISVPNRTSDTNINAVQLLISNTLYLILKQCNLQYIKLLLWHSEILYNQFKKYINI